MRKRLAVLLAAIVVLALMVAEPIAAQVQPQPTVKICPILPFGGLTLGITAKVSEPEAMVFVAQGVATLGPCPGGGGGGGGNGGGGAAPLEITQESEQEAESGDIDQSFEVTGGGDNSNQCAGVQGVANTGNAQNVIDLLQAVSEADDFEFEEVGSDITVSPESPTTCDQQVNQAASASG